jgi:hypothetical protein
MLEVSWYICATVSRRAKTNIPSLGSVSIVLFKVYPRPMCHLPVLTCQHSGRSHSPFLIWASGWPMSVGFFTLTLVFLRGKKPMLGLCCHVRERVVHTEKLQVGLKWLLGPDLWSFSWTVIGDFSKIKDLKGVAPETQTSLGLTETHANFRSEQDYSNFSIPHLCV